MIEITLNKYFRFLDFVPMSHGYEVLFENGDEDMIRFRVAAGDLKVIASELAIADRAIHAISAAEKR